MRILVSGGLGNQMFIYALYYSLKREGSKVQLDTSLYNYAKMHNGYELSDIFETDIPYMTSNILYLSWLRFVLRTGLFLKKDKFKYDENIADSDALYLWGYWQCDKYFEKYREELLKIFKFKNISSPNQEIAHRMQDKNSVSLHIRRGDYMNLSMYQGICTEEYYAKAVEYTKQNVSSPHFYIFSNDIAWSKKFAESLNIDYTIVGHNTGADCYQDMYLMSQCKHNIIANSSFSWWGAYLNANQNKLVIAPKGWDNTDSESYNKVRVPQSFIRL